MRLDPNIAIVLWLVACGPTQGNPSRETPTSDIIEHYSVPEVYPTTETTPPRFELQVWTELVNDTIGLHTNLPAWIDDCLDMGMLEVPCTDADQDGLTDEWEDLVLDRLTPAVRFDESEQIVDDPDAVVAAVGRVAPFNDGSGVKIRAYIMLGYHADYGRCGLSGHDGDSERVVLDLQMGELAGSVDVVGFYTAAHEYTITDHGQVFTGADIALLEFPTDPITGEPRWMVYASDGKHATYGNAQLCEDAEWVICLDEDCDADGADASAYTWLFPVWNAGEVTAPFLTDLGPVGFPGEEAWIDKEFCGGLPGIGGCAGSVREKLLNDPF
jgi:hypothetical protein